SFDDMVDKNLNLSMEQGWAAMMQHYFVSAWIPRTEDTSNLFSRTSQGQGYIGVRLPSATVAPGTEQTLTATLWSGPKLQDKLEATAPNLNLTADYGWLWFIASPLHKLLSIIHDFVAN
ncbi:membrane protein insertase YidC, partial [Photobacterium sp. R1]